jgi:hypothetical protein
MDIDPKLAEELDRAFAAGNKLEALGKASAAADLRGDRDMADKISNYCAMVLDEDEMDVVVLARTRAINEALRSVTS